MNTLVQEVQDGDIVVRIDDGVGSKLQCGTAYEAVAHKGVDADFFSVILGGKPFGSYARDLSIFKSFRKASPEEALQYKLAQSQAKLKAAQEEVAKAEQAVKDAEEAKVFVEGAVYYHSRQCAPRLRILRKVRGGWNLYDLDGDITMENVSARYLTDLSWYTPVTDFEAALKEAFANV